MPESLTPEIDSIALFHGWRQARRDAVELRVARISRALNGWLPPEDTNDPAILGSVAWSFAVRGRPDDAKAWSERAQYEMLGDPMEDFVLEFTAVGMARVPEAFVYSELSAPGVDAAAEILLRAGDIDRLLGLLDSQNALLESLILARARRILAAAQHPEIDRIDGRLRVVLEQQNWEAFRSVFETFARILTTIDSGDTREAFRLYEGFTERSLLPILRSAFARAEAKNPVDCRNWLNVALIGLKRFEGDDFPRIGVEFVVAAASETGHDDLAELALAHLDDSQRARLETFLAARALETGRPDARERLARSLSPMVRDRREEVDGVAFHEAVEFFARAGDLDSLRRLLKGRESLSLGYVHSIWNELPNTNDPVDQRVFLREMVAVINTKRIGQSDTNHLFWLIETLARHDERELAARVLGQLPPDILLEPATISVRLAIATDAREIDAILDDGVRWFLDDLASLCETMPPRGLAAIEPVLGVLVERRRDDDIDALIAATVAQSGEALSDETLSGWLVERLRQSALKHRRFDLADRLVHDTVQGEWGAIRRARNLLDLVQARADDGESDAATELRARAEDQIRALPLGWERFDLLAEWIKDLLTRHEPRLMRTIDRYVEDTKSLPDASKIDASELEDDLFRLRELIRYVALIRLAETICFGDDAESNGGAELWAARRDAMRVLIPELEQAADALKSKNETEFREREDDLSRIAGVCLATGDLETVQSLLALLTPDTGRLLRLKTACRSGDPATVADAVDAYLKGIVTTHDWVRVRELSEGLWAFVADDVLDENRPDTLLARPIVDEARRLARDSRRRVAESRRLADESYPDDNSLSGSALILGLVRTGYVADAFAIADEAPGVSRREVLIDFIAAAVEQTLSNEATPREFLPPALDALARELRENPLGEYPSLQPWLTLLNCVTPEFTWPLLALSPVIERGLCPWQLGVEALLSAFPDARGAIVDAFLASPNSPTTLDPA